MFAVRRRTSRRYPSHNRPHARRASLDECRVSRQHDLLDSIEAACSADRSIIYARRPRSPARSPARSSARSLACILSVATTRVEIISGYKSAVERRRRRRRRRRARGCGGRERERDEWLHRVGGPTTSARARARACGRTLSDCKWPRCQKGPQSIQISFYCQSKLCKRRFTK